MPDGDNSVDICIAIWSKSRVNLKKKIKGKERKHERPTMTILTVASGLADLRTHFGHVPLLSQHDLSLPTQLRRQTSQHSHSVDMQNFSRIFEAGIWVIFYVRANP